jgi:transcriptional regulator with XRE-family HTH domain
MTPDERAALVAQRLVSARKYSGLTIAQVAKMVGDEIGIDDAFTFKPTIRSLQILADLYVVDFAWLVGIGPDLAPVDILGPDIRAKVERMSSEDRDKFLRAVAMSRRT